MPSTAHNVFLTIFKNIIYKKLIVNYNVFPVFTTLCQKQELDSYGI